MKRIGYLVWTERFRKGTSRKRRRRAYATFRRMALIANKQLEHFKPQLDRAFLDVALYGETMVKVVWDGDFAQMERI